MWLVCERRAKPHRYPTRAVYITGKAAFGLSVAADRREVLSQLCREGDRLLVETFRGCAARARARARAAIARITRHRSPGRPGGDLPAFAQRVAGDAERLARFRREAQTLGALNHPHTSRKSTGSKKQTASPRW
jgi:hypothetical protein